MNLVLNSLILIYYNHCYLCNGSQNGSILFSKESYRLACPTSSACSPNPVNVRNLNDRQTSLVIAGFHILIDFGQFFRRFYKQNLFKMPAKAPLEGCTAQTFHKYVIIFINYYRVFNLPLKGENHS